MQFYEQIHKSIPNEPRRFQANKKVLALKYVPN